MDFITMQREVLRRLQDPDSSSIFWSTDDIKDALNEAYQEISDATQWYEKNVTLSLKAQTYYDLRQEITDTILAFKRAFNTQTNWWVKPSSVRELDYATYTRWETVTGEPQKLWLKGLWFLGTFPHPGTASGTIKVYYSAIPNPMTADSDTPGFPREFHSALVDYAVYDLLCQDAETEKALGIWGEYKLKEMALKRFVQGRITTDRVGGFRG